MILKQRNFRVRQSNSSRYKTELCRAYEEYGTCKYGEKCQFAHGITELRSLCRHPKYKTELCRTYHTEGFCPYGKRCHFVHTPKDEMVNLSNKIELSPMDLHPYSEPLYLDSFSSPPHISHLTPSYFDGRKNDFYIFKHQDLSDLKRYTAMNQPYFQSSSSPPVPAITPPSTVQWNATEALQQAINEVTSNRLPVFARINTA